MSFTTPEKKFSVAIVGSTGLVGAAILPTFLSSPYISTLKLLTTDLSNPKLPTAGAELHKITWNDKGSLVKALKGTHVLLSCLNSRGAGFEVNWEVLIQAASEAKVHIYFPSEFGTDASLAPDRSAKFANFAFKEAHRKTAEFIGLTVWQVCTGMFLEGGMTPRACIDIPNKKWMLASDGNTPFAFTSMSDLGPFIHRSIVASVHAPSLLPLNHKLRVYSSCNTWKGYLSTYEDVFAEKIAVDWRSIETLDRERDEMIKAKNPADFVWLVKILGEEGGFDHEKDNDLISVLEKEEFGGMWERRTMEMFARDTLAGMGQVAF